jgi:Flp pilus assembly pilin Flp
LPRNSSVFPLARNIVSTSTRRSPIKALRVNGLHFWPVTKPYWLGGRSSVLLLALTCILGLVRSASGQVTIMSPSAAPAVIDSNDASAVEVGVKFSAATSGYITGLRFYKATTNVGTHVGHIWSNSGALLGSATFTNETASGWQQVTFSTPIPVSAGTNYFATKGVNNPPLQALANGVDGPNGVYLYSSTGGFPANGYESTYYWVDIVYTASQSTSASGQVTIMNPSAIPAVIDSNDANPVEVGVKFSAATSGYITGLRFYKATTNVGTHVGHIWSNSGAQLGSATFTNETASGWQQVTFSTPIPVSAGTTYVASYFAPEGHYSANTNYFATKGVNNPPLQALANGVDGPNGVYLYSSTGGFPTNGYESTYYWVDVVYTASQSTSGGGTAGNPQLTLSPATLSFGSVIVNSPATQSLTLTSSGTAPVTVNSVSITGAGFTIVAATLPVTLAPNSSMTLQVQFEPIAAGSATGNLTISSNSASSGTAVVTLSGTGTAGNSQLTLGATSLSFGNVSVNSPSTQSLTLTSSGTAPVTVNSLSIAGAGFTIVGGSAPVTLNPNQSLTLHVQFEPTAAGSATGTLTISSNSASGGAAVVSLGGTGTAVSHTANLSWEAPSSSSDPVAGYHVYRSTGGEAAQLITSSMDTQTSYVDTSVASGSTYIYTVKSVDKSGVESSPSNETSVTIP